MPHTSTEAAWKLNLKNRAITKKNKTFWTGTERKKFTQPKEELIGMLRHRIWLYFLWKWKWKSLSTLCDPMDFQLFVTPWTFCDPPGILQARILECVAIPFSRVNFPGTTSLALQADSLLLAEPWGKLTLFSISLSNWQNCLYFIVINPLYEMQKGKMVIWGGPTKSWEKQSESKREKERHAHLNADFPIIARRDKKAFLAENEKK